MEELKIGTKLYHYKFGAMTVIGFKENDLLICTFDKYDNVDVDGVVELDEGKHMFEIAAVGKWIFKTMNEVAHQLVAVEKVGGRAIMPSLHSGTSGVMVVNYSDANHIYDELVKSIKEEEEKRAAEETIKKTEEKEIATEEINVKKPKGKKPEIEIKRDSTVEDIEL